MHVIECRRLYVVRSQRSSGTRLQTYYCRYFDPVTLRGRIMPELYAGCVQLVPYC